MTPQVTTGNTPLLLAMPHGGTWIPGSILSRLNPLGREMADTDWHIDELYQGLVSDVTIVSTPVHRYVIDANRDPAGGSLYPGQNTTGLCPTTSFDGEAIYLAGEEPDAIEIEQRQHQYHQPYHDALQIQLQRIKQKHGYAILYDCHSIRSEIPFLFDGKLADFNIGTNNETSCSGPIQALVESICNHQTHYRSVCNDRFKGGWTTRYYGRPQKGYHAIQMELAQCIYMLESAPWTYLPERAAGLREILKQILEGLKNFDSL